MRLNIFVAASLLFTLVSGLTIPSKSLYEREAELIAREAVVDEVLELVAREPIFSRFKKYHVPGGPGRPARESDLLLHIAPLI